MRELNVVCVDAEATAFATFQCHNQKVIENQGGIFFSYIKSRDEPYLNQHWRIMRSTDGGKSFTVLIEGMDATNPTPLETDAEGNLYFVTSYYSKGFSIIHKLTAESDYREKKSLRIEGASGGKYCMAWDEKRKRLYYMTNAKTDFVAVSADLELLIQKILINIGPLAELEYPALCMSPDGVLHCAYTTNTHGGYKINLGST